MPRLSGAYKLGGRTVLKAGYGMFYDTLNAANYTPLTTGYSATTTRVTSNDFGLTWALGNPARGILPQTDPFPLRCRRQPLRPDRRRQPRHRLVARQRRHDRQPGSQAPAGPALSGERPARALGHVERGGRLQLPGRRSAADDAAHGLPAGGVLERQQRQGRHAAELPADQRAQSVPAVAISPRSRRPTPPSMRAWRAMPSSRTPRCSSSGSSAGRIRSMRRSTSPTCRSASRRRTA